MVVGVVSFIPFSRYFFKEGARWGLDLMDIFMAALMTVFFTAIMVGIAVGLTFGIGFLVPKDLSDKKTENLVSLRSSPGVSGQFYLGTGGIDSSQYYYFYVDLGDGYQPRSIEAGSNVVVYEQNRPDAIMKTYTKSFSSKAFWAIGLTIPTKRYEFYIPEGSLKKDFSLE